MLMSWAYEARREELTLAERLQAGLGGGILLGSEGSGFA